MAEQARAKAQPEAGPQEHKPGTTSAPVLPARLASLTAATGDPSVGQAARVSDPGMQTAQRHAAIARIGRVQGNQYVGRVIQAAKPQRSNETSPPPAAHATDTDHTPIPGDQTPALVQRQGGPGAAGGMDASSALSTVMATLIGELKAGKRREHTFPMNRKLGKYATLTGATVSVEAELGASAKGSAVTIARGGSETTSSESTMQETGRRKNQLKGTAKSSATEVQAKVTEHVNKALGVQLEDVSFKWANESIGEEEIKGAIELQAKGKSGVLGGVKLEVSKLDLKHPSQSTMGAAAPYLGYEKELGKLTITPKPLDWVTLPPIEIAGKVKAQLEATVQLNKSAILLEFAKRLGPKILERVALYTGSKAAASIAARVIGGARAVFSVPGAMISAGVMSVLTLLDAYIEGHRIRNLGTLAQRLVFVFSGAYVKAYSGKGEAPSGGDSATAQFASVGAQTAKKHKQEILDKVKQKAEEEGYPMKGKAPAVFKEQVDKYIEENPVGIGTILPMAKPQIDKYILDRFVKGREEAWTRKAMGFVVGIWGGSPGDVKDSYEYEKFKEDYLPAYTDDKAYQLAIKYAMEDLEEQGKPVNPDNVNEALYDYFTEKAQESERELQ